MKHGGFDVFNFDPQTWSPTTPKWGNLDQQKPRNLSTPNLNLLGPEGADGLPRRQPRRHQWLQSEIEAPGAAICIRGQFIAPWWVEQKWALQRAFLPWIFGIFYGRFLTNFLPWASLSLHGRVKSYDRAQLLSFNTCWPSCPFHTCWGWSQIIIKLINAHQAQRMTNFCTQSQGKAHIPSPVGTPQVSLGGSSPPRTDEVPSPHSAGHIFVQENRKGN